MRLEEIKGKLHLCLIITFFVNALTSAVVTEQVPINTIFRERTRMCVCAGNTALATQPCPRNLYVSIQPRHAMVRNRTHMSGGRVLEVRRTMSSAPR